MMMIEPQQARVWNGRFVDVRNLDEYAAEHLNGPECVPLDRLLSAAGRWDPQDRTLLICKSGIRATQAAQQLEQVGFTDVHVVAGGLEACKRAGIEVICGRKVIPIQRQVLIGAGIVLLGGLALAHVHPAFIAVDWFVAAMLVVAGVSGFCPMAKILARMPWNAALSGQSGVPTPAGACVKT